MLPSNGKGCKRVTESRGIGSSEKETDLHLCPGFGLYHVEDFCLLNLSDLQFPRLLGVMITLHRYGNSKLGTEQVHNK